MNAVGVRLSGGEVLLGAVGVEYVRRALVVALDMHQVHGRPVPSGLRDVAALLGAAVLGSPVPACDGSPGLPLPSKPSSSVSGLVDTKEAAAMLGCGVRNVCDLVDRGVLTSVRDSKGQRHRLERSEVARLQLRREDSDCA